MRHGAPILERATEQAAIEQLLADAASSSGHVLVVESPAGSGKTTLVRHTLELAHEAGVRALHATGSELESGFPYGMARQMLEPALEGLSRSQRERVLAGPAGLAKRALGEEISFSRGATQAHAAVHGLFRLSVNLAAEAPLLLIADDAQWGDFGSLQFLYYLARRVGGIPLGLLIATRPIDASDAPSPLLAMLALEETSVVRPQPLSSEAVAELTRHVLQDDPAPPFVDACAQATGGNAFLVTALLEELARERIAPTETAARELQTRAPDTVRRRITAALSALPESAAIVARSLAVLGEATIPLLARHARVDADEVREACLQLEHAGLLDAAEAVRFAHPLQANVVAGTIPATERSEAHLEAARLLVETGAPLDACAAHLLASRPAESDWVASLLSRAAKAALARGAPAEAAGYLQRALEEPAPARSRPELLLELGTARLRLRDSEHAETALRLGLACDPDPQLRHGLSIALSQTRYLTGDADGALDVLEEARREERDERRLLTLDVNAMSIGLLDPEREGLMRSRLAEYRRRVLTGELHEPGLLALAGAEAILRVDAEIDGLPLVQAAFDRGLTAFDTDTFPFGWAICALEAADRSAEAIVRVDEALAEARPLADAALTAYLLSYRSHLAFRTGDIAEAESDGRAAYELLAHVQDDVSFPVALLDALMERGKAQEAWEISERHRHQGSPQRSAMLELVRAHVAIVLGRGAEALPGLLEAGRELDLLSVRHPQFAPWRAIAAPVAQELGQHELAARLAAEGLALARTSGAPTALAQALRVQGTLEHELPPLLHAVELTAATPDLLEHARSLAALGAAQAESDRREDARQTLRTALAVAHEAGAFTLAEKVRKELVAVGGRPRRAALRGLEALTPSELQVARMAARGLSNRDIADGLFVSLKTVEQHLARTYAKLEISSRRDLPAALKRSSSELPAISWPGGPGGRIAAA